MKKVRALEDITFENGDLPFIAEGTEFTVGGVLGNGIILQNEAGEAYVIDSATFEAGFEIART